MTPSHYLGMGKQTVCELVFQIHSQRKVLVCQTHFFFQAQFSVENKSCSAPLLTISFAKPSPLEGLFISPTFGLQAHILRAGRATSPEPGDSGGE